MEAKYLKINPADNVAVAITALPAGEKLTVDGKEITLNEDVPAGHKFALKDFAEGENVIKYGYPIGHARKAQKQGDWMNENNIKTNLSGLLEYTYNPVNVDLNTTTLNLNTGAPNLTFRGYKRKNGDVGVRNEIWIIPTVGCVNGIINQLAEGLRRETGGKGVDAIMAYPHNYGCSQLGDDHENTKKILRDMVLHPNAGAVLVVGLGCENNQPDVFREFLGPARGYSLKRTARRPEVWRFGRFLRYHRQSATGHVLRLPRSTRRHQRTDGSAGNVRRRNHTDEPLPHQRAV